MYPADAPQSTSRYLFAAYDPLRNLIHMGALAGGYLHATSLACRCCPNGSTFLCPGFLLPFFKSLLRPCLPCSSSLLSSFLPDLSDPIPDKWSTGLLPLPHNPTVFLMLAPAWLGSLHLPLGSPKFFFSFYVARQQDSRVFFFATFSIFRIVARRQPCWTRIATLFNLLLLDIYTLRLGHIDSRVTAPACKSTSANPLRN